MLRWAPWLDLRLGQNLLSPAISPGLRMKGARESQNSLLREGVSWRGFEGTKRRARQGKRERDLSAHTPGAFEEEGSFHEDRHHGRRERECLARARLEGLAFGRLPGVRPGYLRAPSLLDGKKRRLTRRPSVVACVHA